MMNNVKSRLIGTAVACFAIVGLLASPVGARLIVRDGAVDFNIDGVDVAGMPDFNRGAFVPSKQYKYTISRIAVEIGAGRVTNDSGRAQVYANRGIPMTDAETRGVVFADSDVTVVARNRGTFNARASQVAVDFQ